MKKPRSIRMHEIKIMLSNDELEQFNSVATYFRITRAAAIRQTMQQKFLQLFPRAILKPF